MQKIFVEHIFDVPRDTFVQEFFFGEEFNRSAHAHMRFKRRQVLEDHDEERRRAMRIEYVTSEKLPWVARKLFGHADVGWIEELNYCKRSHQANITMIGHILADRIRSNGVMTFHEHPGGRTRRTFDIDVHVAVPAVGRAIEKKMLGDTRKNFDLMAAFTRCWIRDRRLAHAV